MKSMKSWSIAMLVVSTVALAPLAEAKRVFFSGSGTTVAAQIDLDGDGLPTASHQTSTGTGTFGPFNVSGIGEITPWDGSSFCSSSEVKLVGLIGTTVTTYASGDQSYARENGDSVLCFDYTKLSWTLRGTQTVTGGTGIFAGATGTLSFKTKGQVLLDDASGNTAFQAFSFVTTGDIQLVSRPPGN